MRNVAVHRYGHTSALILRVPLPIKGLAGVCETDTINAEAFQWWCPGVPVFKELTAALDSVRPDVVSL